MANECGERKKEKTYLEDVIFEAEDVLAVELVRVHRLT